MEQQVGLGTHYLNWVAAEEAISDLASPTWVPITYYDPHGLLERMRFVPGALRSALRCYRQVEEALKQGPYDALLFNTHNPAVIHLRSVSRYKTFLQFDVTPALLDGLETFYPNNSFGRHNPLLDRFKASRVREAYQRAAGLFPWSNWAAKSAIEEYGVAPERVHVIPPGIDTTLWQPDLEKVSDGVVRILFTGGDLRRKGGDLLLRWARETTLRGWELHMVTRDPVVETPGVFVYNQMNRNAPELIALTRRCDLFVLPTLADCFNLAAMEAMACGLPVLITAVGGIPDIVTENETGRLVPAGDYDALAHTLEAMIADAPARERMGRRAREVVQEKFDARKTLRQAAERMLS
jgi:glycosyltransferase involved in cell wall biosynthesis